MDCKQARPHCPSPTPRVYSNSCPLSRWCHPTISSSVVPFSSCPQSFPASGSFRMSQFFTSGGQYILWYSYLLSQWTSLQINLCPPLIHFFGRISKKWNYWVKYMNFQSSCYCHATSYTLSVNLQFIAPKKNSVFTKSDT